MYIYTFVFLCVSKLHGMLYFMTAYGWVFDENVTLE